MLENLNSTYAAKCFSTIDYFQLRSVDLPNEYESAIEQTEVKRQDIQKAEAERNKTAVVLDTNVKQAKVSQEIQINAAQGEAQATLQRNAADIASFQANQWAQLQSYTALKTDLSLNDTDFLQFLENKLVTGYDGGSLLISLQ